MHAYAGGGGGGAAERRGWGGVASCVSTPAPALAGYVFKTREPNPGLWVRGVARRLLRPPATPPASQPARRGPWCDSASDTFSWRARVEREGTWTRTAGRGACGAIDGRLGRLARSPPASRWSMWRMQVPHRRRWAARVRASLRVYGALAAALLKSSLRGRLQLGLMRVLITPNSTPPRSHILV